MATYISQWFGSKNKDFCQSPDEQCESGQDDETRDEPLISTEIHTIEYEKYRFTLFQISESFQIEAVNEDEDKWTAKLTVEYFSGQEECQNLVRHCPSIFISMFRFGKIEVADKTANILKCELKSDIVSATIILGKVIEPESVMMEKTIRRQRKEIDRLASNAKLMTEELIELRAHVKRMCAEPFPRWILGTWKYQNYNMTLIEQNGSFAIKRCHLGTTTFQPSDFRWGENAFYWTMKQSGNHTTDSSYRYVLSNPDAIIETNSGSENVFARTSQYTSKEMIGQWRRSDGRVVNIEFKDDKFVVSYPTFIDTGKSVPISSRTGATIHLTHSHYQQFADNLDVIIEKEHGIENILKRV